MLSGNPGSDQIKDQTISLKKKKMLSGNPGSDQTTDQIKSLKRMNMLSGHSGSDQIKGQNNIFKEDEYGTILLLEQSQKQRKYKDIL